MLSTEMKMQKEIIEQTVWSMEGHEYTPSIPMSTVQFNITQTAPKEHNKAMD